MGNSKKNLQQRRFWNTKRNQNKRRNWKKAKITSKPSKQSLYPEDQKDHGRNANNNDNPNENLEEVNPKTRKNDDLQVNNTGENEENNPTTPRNNISWVWSDNEQNPVEDRVKDDASDHASNKLNNQDR